MSDVDPLLPDIDKRLVALKPAPKLVTLDGLLTHGYIDIDTLEAIKSEIIRMLEGLKQEADPLTALDELIGRLSK